MYKIKNFDDWEEDIESGKFGSGASEKIWLVNKKTSEKGLFKYPKIKTNEVLTGEYWAEKIASELASLLDIRCSNVDIGYYNGRIGSMNYNFVKEDEILAEGVTFIENKYINYNKDKLVDDVSDKKYSLQMIEECIPSGFMKFIYQMILFDALIGNSDRHHSNWGFIYKFNYQSGLTLHFSPLYDNGSSLCAYVNENDIDKLFKDKMMYNALLETKSKSTIGWNNKRPIGHFELIRIIRDNHYDATINYVLKIKEKITENNVNKILNNFDKDIISDKMKGLLLKFILDRRDKILNIYNVEDNDE